MSWQEAVQFMGGLLGPALSETSSFTTGHSREDWGAWRLPISIHLKNITPLLNCGSLLPSVSFKQVILSDFTEYGLATCSTSSIDLEGHSGHAEGSRDPPQQRTLAGSHVIFKSNRKAPGLALTWKDFIKVHSNVRMPSPLLRSFTNRITRKRRKKVMEILLLSSEFWRVIMERSNPMQSRTCNTFRKTATDANKGDRGKNGRCVSRAFSPWKAWRERKSYMLTTQGLGNCIHTAHACPHGRVC